MSRSFQHVFPYRADISGQYYPILSVTLENRSAKKDFFALIDSGATTSIFRSEVADALGIDIEKGKRVILRGVAGRIQGYIHSVQMEAAGRRFNCPIVFSQEYLVSLNLLGRDTFFEQFTIIFEKKRKRLTLK